MVETGPLKSCQSLARLNQRQNNKENGQDTGDLEILHCPPFKGEEGRHFMPRVRVILPSGTVTDLDMRP